MISHACWERLHILLSVVIIGKVLYSKAAEVLSSDLLNQAHAEASVRLVSRNHFRAAKVCVCVSTPEAISN